MLSTHKFCDKCGCDTPRGSQGACKPCDAARKSVWRKENLQQTTEYKKKWREKNLILSREINSRWDDANKDKRAKAASAFYEFNKESIKQKCAEWRSKNKEKVYANWKNRRAKTSGASGNLTAGLREKLFVLQQGKCACCGQDLGESFHMDHIMPIALGGANTDDNIQLLRQRCNNQKYTKHPVDFMQERGFLL